MSIMLALSLSCRAFYCAMFPLFPLWWDFLSWIDVEFYLTIFLHLFRWPCGFCGVSCVSCDHVFLWCFVWRITLIDLHVLNHPCDPGMNPTWSWCMVLFMCCWTQFANVLFRILTSILIKDIGLCIYFWECVWFEIIVIVVSQNDFGNVPFHSIFWKSLKNIGISFSLYVW